MTNNCSDAVLFALGVDLGRLDSAGQLIPNARVPREYPEVSDLKKKIRLGKIALPIITPDTVARPWRS